MGAESYCTCNFERVWCDVHSRQQKYKHVAAVAKPKQRPIIICILGSPDANRDKQTTAKPIQHRPTKMACSGNSRLFRAANGGAEADRSTRDDEGIVDTSRDA